MIWGSWGKFREGKNFPRDCLCAYFSPEKGWQNFFPEKRYQKKNFPDFLQARPQMINGRSLI